MRVCGKLKNVILNKNELNKLSKKVKAISTKGLTKKVTDGSMGKNVTIFGGDMSSSVHVDNKNKDIVILAEGPIQGSDDTTLTEEAKYPINFT